MVGRLGDTKLEPCYLGLRMSAEEFLALPESSVRYELVDGVVVMAPSASFEHQDVVGEIVFQIRGYLESHPIGKVVTDVDVRLRDNLVYRPDIAYVNSEKVARVDVRILEAPDLVVEIVSPDSRQRDARTKREDYEAAGVGEYWIIDPQANTFHAYVMRDGAFVEIATAGDRYAAAVLPGFGLDLGRVRRL